MLLTLLSAIFGGALRLAPELLKFLGQKDQDQHELLMQDKQYLFLQLQGKQALQQQQLAGNINEAQQQLATIQALNAQQASMSVTAGGWVNQLNALVRPLITFFIFGMWGANRVATMMYAYHASGDLVSTLMNCWTNDDAAMLSMIASFYFVGRSIDKAQGM